MYSNLRELKLILDGQLHNSSDQLLSTGYALKKICQRVQILRLLTSISNDESEINQIAKQSCTHPNGFDKIVLLESKNPDYRLRIHVWWEDSGQIRPEDVHNHTWDFSSAVLVGSLHSQEFQVSEIGIEKFHFLHKGQGLGRNPIINSAGKKNIRCMSDSTLTTGSYYSLSNEVLHRVIKHPSQTTVTLVVQGSFMSSESDIFADQPLQIEKNELPMRWFKPSEFQDKLLSLIAVLNQV